MTATLEAVACAVCGCEYAAPARVRPPRDAAAFAVGHDDGRSSWVVCQSCGLVYQSPRPTDAALEALYEGGEYHEVRGGVPEHYVQYSLRRSESAIDWALSGPWIDGGPGRALDIGCGVGGALVTLRERGWAVRGVEPDPELSEMARARFGLDVVTDILRDGTFSSGESFDLAYSCHVWEHLTAPIATARVAHQLLADRSGVFVVVVPTYRRARTWAWSCFSTPHTYLFDHRSLGNTLGRAGFEVVGHRYAAGADSELWLVARATGRELHMRDVDRDDVRRVQRELSSVPLKAALGAPGRLRAHARTLQQDPGDFGRRLARWTARRVRQVKAALAT